MEGKFRLHFLHVYIKLFFFILLKNSMHYRADSSASYAEVQITH